MNVTGNLFSLDVVQEKGVEQRETVGLQVGLSITRSVSTGCATPPGIWCSENGGGIVVVVLGGEVGLLIKGEVTPRILAGGDYLIIDDQSSYRIEWTHPSELTVWLVIQKLEWNNNVYLFSTGEQQSIDMLET